MLSMPLSLLVALSLTAASVGVAFATTYLYDFSSTLSPWTGGKDAAVTDYTFTLARDDDSTGCLSASDGYALLTLISRTDDQSGIWMQASFPNGAADTSAVTVEWDARNKGKCSQCKLLAYAGASAPTSTSNFASIDTAPSNWTRYSYSTSVIGASDTIYVALGWKGPVDDLPAKVGFDCVKIDITP